ncbi:serine kinase [Sinorhizobium numidicum]|uniref:Serine kinase n=1 Tax=Sinorhizobium numidicum TaxID=680248 RepID=A0ABY8D4L0_9HYPH|nr:serine kinase [Sinorhizobium numidicum]WEX77988.1 serine kinase [Sinorhizobium numidicum]WEX84647.1 serine kinase [Sinorhizobium numidicum]
MKFRVSDGARFFLLGQRKTVFVESSQQIFEVDDLTAYLTCTLAEATSFQQLEADLTGRGISPRGARSFIKEYLLYWSRQQLLDIVLDREDGAPLHRQVLDLAGTAVSVAYHDQGLLDLVLPVFDHQASQDLRPSISYEVARFGDRACIIRNRSGGTIVTAAEAAPTLKASLTDDVLANVGTNVALHAALLVKKSNGLLLCGAPGAGKTTLALALLERGFACGGDDIALMSADGLLRGVPFAPALKRGSWNLFAGLQDAIMACPIHRRLDNKNVRYLAPVRYAPRETVPLGTIVLIRRRKKGPAVISDVEPARVLSELLSGAFTPAGRLSLMQFQSLLHAISGARTIELTFSRLDEAVEVLSRYHDGK